MKLRPSKKHVAAVLALGLGMTGLVAAPAAAGDDDTTEFTDSFTFVDVNPCSGEEISITINTEGEVRDRGDRVDVRIDRTGTTSDGYVMDKGKERIRLENGVVVKAKFKDVWETDEGSKFIAQGKFRMDADTGEVEVDTFSLTCED